MKIKRPLINPVLSETSDPTEYEKKTGAISPDQLKFKVDDRLTKFRQFLSFLKMNIQKKGEALEVSMLWKSASLPFAIITFLVNILLILVGGIIFFDRIPPRIPLIYNSFANQWEQSDKTVIFIFGLLFVFFEILMIEFSIKIFFHDRRLSLTMNWILTFLNILLLIAILQIYNLII